MSDFAEFMPELDLLKPGDCFHEPAETGLCSLCNQVVSPPRLRPKGLQKPVQAGVGTGHGHKVTGWCSTREEADSLDNEMDDSDASIIDSNYMSPRIRRDRKPSELPPRRQTRSMVHSRDLFSI